MSLMLRERIGNIVCAMGERDWRIPIQEAAIRACSSPYINAAGLIKAAGWNSAQSMTKFLEKATGDEHKVRARQREEDAMQRVEDVQRRDRANKGLMG